MLPVRLSQFLHSHLDIVSENGRYFRPRSLYPIQLPSEFDESLCRLIGWIHGDGNMSYRRILITDECLDFHQDVLRPTFARLFGVAPNIYHDRARNTFYTHLKSSILYDFMTQALEVPSGSVRNKLKVPSYIKELNLKLRSAYVGGLYDAEGHVKKRQAEIDFSTTCKDIQVTVNDVLSASGINHTLYSRSRRPNEEHEIYIYGKDDLRRFEDCIQFTHPIKKHKLANAIPLH